MIKISLKEELKSEKEKLHTKMESSEAVKTVKLLEQQSAAEDMRILMNLAPNCKLARVNEELGKKLELEKIENEYKGDVFTIDQIKKLAIKYNLRFLRSKLFAGDFDPKVILELKEFARETKSDLNNWALENKFFILAPAEEFNLDSKIHYAEKIVPKDPLMFYQIDDKHYRFVYKWGTDFTILRRIKGFYNADINNWFISMSVVIMLIFSSIIGVCQYFNVGLTEWFASITCWTLVVIFSFLIAAISCLGKYDANGDLIKGYFGKYNWNSTDRIVGKGVKIVRK